MTAYNVECPFCGTVNHDLDLEETNGWMECEHCQQVVQVSFESSNVLPAVAFAQMPTRFATAN